MKNYKDIKVYLGSSDTASLDFFITYTGERIKLKFGSDGEYSAYVCHNFTEKEIPEHYKKVFETSHFAGITFPPEISTEPFTVRFTSIESIQIYRAGDFGCIINLVDKIGTEFKFEECFATTLISTGDNSFLEKGYKYITCEPYEKRRKYIDREV